MEERHETTYEIIAGKRRFRAASVVADEIGEGEPVPCAIIAACDEAAALEASLIENIARLDPDEVTRWESFTRLVREGYTPADIALTFDLTELQVVPSEPPPTIYSGRTRAKVMRAMYLPPAFKEDRIEILRATIRNHPLATLITSGEDGLIANVVPFSLRTGPDRDTLCAHLAKANEQIVALRKRTPALVLFQGPQAYVTPSWYPTKREHGKVVPTWNYVIVQARGMPCVIDDKEWLRSQLQELTHAQESERAIPWAIDDAPVDYIEGRIKGIVGLQIPVDRMEGKWKVSQNQPMANRIGVAEGLQSEGHSELARAAIARANGS